MTPYPIYGTDRGQAIGISRLFLALIVGAILIFIIQQVTNPLFEHANSQTQSNSKYAQGTDWLTQATDPQTLGLVILVVSMFGVITYSVYQREVLR